MEFASRPGAGGIWRAWGLRCLLVVGLAACGGGGGMLEPQAANPAPAMAAQNATAAPQPAAVPKAADPARVALAYRAVIIDPAGGLVGPSSLNDAGQVAYSRGGHAFFYDGLSVRDIGTLGGATATASGINNLGQITGSSTTAQGEAHAFRWTPTGPTSGVMLDLGAPAGHSSVGEAIDDAGQVAGTTRTGNEPSRAFRWTEGVGMVDLGVLEPGAQFPFAAGLLINSAGQVAGLSTVAGNPSLSQSFFWSPETGIRTVAGPASVPNDLNDAGQVVGIVQGAFLSSRAFLWSAGGGLIDLGTLGGTHSGALAINELGQVVGESQATPGGGLHAFFWSAGVMTDMGTLGGDASSAVDINDAGVAVGAAQLADATFRAFAWTPADGMVDLTARVAGAPAEFAVGSAAAVAANGTILVRSNLGLALLKPVGDDGFVTGSVSLAGARFGVVVRYDKGANRPSGKVTFSLRTANFEFESTGFDWLDVAAGRAQVQGTGTLNGPGGYFFRVSVVDGGPGNAPDMLALRIWHVDAATGAEVVDYDNGGGVVTNAGNLVVHPPRGG